jgi:acetyl esterase/lipase
MAPEFPFPTPLEDCFAALKWLLGQSQSLNVDSKRIILIGDSGGGNLTAGLSLLARDRGVSPPPAKQILIYPMLDDRSSDIAALKPDDPRTQYFSGYINMSKVCWDAYLGKPTGASLNPETQSYACPARAEVLAGLPPTYIDVGSLDLFRDESLAFASKLVAANVDVEFHLYEGVPHCFDLIARDIPITRNATENRRRAIRSV